MPEKLRVIRNKLRQGGALHGRVKMLLAKPHSHVYQRPSHRGHREAYGRDCVRVPGLARVRAILVEVQGLKHGNA